jgi:DNA-binding response OmpR family regulator
MPMQMTKLRILIVEDDDDARVALERLLSRHGYTAVSASNADSALARAKEHNPDIAICDWMLPGDRDGVEVARAIQRQYRSAVIFVTAYPVAELHKRSLDIQVNAYLSKPLNPQQLLAEVNRARP